MNQKFKEIRYINPVFLIYTWFFRSKAPLMLTAIAVTMSVDSYALRIQHKSDGTIFLEDTCKEIKEHVRSIVEWAKSRGEQPQVEKIDCEDDQIISIEVSKLMPSSARFIENCENACYGPNCFNSTMVDAKELLYQRHTSEEEWNNFLENKCKKRYGEPRPGDIVAIRKKTGPNTYEEIHGFIFVNKLLASSKNGYGTKSQYLLQFLDDVLTGYGFIDPEHGNNPEVIPPPDCDVFINFFEYSPKEKQDISLTAFEYDLSALAMNGDLEIYPFVKKRYQELQNLEPWLVKSYKNQISYAEAKLLNECAKKGDLEEFKTLLALGMDINADANNQNALFCAVGANHLHIVDYVLKLGADKTGLALALAADLGHLQIVERLLAEPSINVNYVHTDGTTPLYNAAQGGHVEIVEKLLAVKGIDLFYANKKGETALSIAIEKGHDEVVEKICSFLGIDTDIYVDDLCNERLIDCAKQGDLKQLKVLLALGLNKNALVNDVSALFMAAMANQFEIVDYLLSLGAARPSFALALAAYHGRLQIVERLLAVPGIDVNFFDEEGNTPLSQASLNGQFKVVEMLLAVKGIDVFYANNKGETALLIAIKNKHWGVGNTLCSFLGLDANSIHIDDLSSQGLINCAQKGDLQQLKLLLAMGVDKNTSVNGAYALLNASMANQLHIVDYLLSLNAKGPGFALLLAASCGHLRIVERLLAVPGINVNFADDGGNTLLHAAILYGHLETVEMLLTVKGIDASFANKQGDTPLSIAMQKGHTEIAKKLRSFLAVDVKNL